MDLLRLYERYAAGLNLKLSVLDGAESDLGGASKVVAEITGEFAYRAFKWERGVHRVQRVPATESQGRIHTSTVTVAVLPEARIDDGQLDTLVVAPRGITGWAGVVAGMVTRGSVGGGNVSYHQGTQVDVQLATPTRAQVDGDGVGYVTRIAGRIVPKALTVRVRPVGQRGARRAGFAA